MGYLDEKQSTKMEKSKQSLLLVLIIFISLLSFLLGILTCMVLTNKGDKQDAKEVASIENNENFTNGTATVLSEEELELLKEELRQAVMEELEKDNSSKTEATDRKSEKEDEEDIEENSLNQSDKDKKTVSDEDSDKVSNKDKDEKKKDEKDKGHRYELLVEDISWTDAEKRCKEKGGYLATITTKEEFDVVTKQIEDEKKTGISFFVGATRDENYVKHSGGSIAYHWVHDGSDVNLYDSDTKGFWLEDEPSFNGKRADGSEIEEMYVDMIYRESENRCYFNDVANNVLEQIPGFTGSVGYICEYED